MDKMKLNVGIDLGTTNSECYVSCNGGRLEPVCFSNGDKKKPAMLASIVSYQNGEFVVGNELKEDAYKFLKSWKYLKVKMKDEENYTYEGKPSDEPFPLTISPVDFSAEILKAIKQGIAKRFGNYEIETLVITVPAYFRDFERRSVLRAVKKAGLYAIKKIALINEPTAAALAYGERLQNDQKIIAFDLGGGTFDVTLLEYQLVDNYRFYQAISTNGSEIGGKNFDEKLLNLLYENFINQDGGDYKNDKEFKEAFFLTFLPEMENLKQSLNFLSDVSVDNYVKIRNEEMYVTSTVSAKSFNEMISPYIQTCIQMTKNVIGTNKVNKLILVGGSTRMPYIQQELRKAFPDLELVGEDPDLIVAKGAAMHAKEKDSENEKKLFLNEIVSNAVGVSLIGDFVGNVVKAGTPIPYKTTERFCGVVRNQTNIEMLVLNGNSPVVQGNEILGTIQLNNLRTNGEVPEFDVTIAIGEDSIVDVNVKQVDAIGKETSAKFAFSDNHQEEADIREKAFELAAREAFLDAKEDDLVSLAQQTINQYSQRDDSIASYVVSTLNNALKSGDLKMLKETLYRTYLCSKGVNKA